MSDNQTRPFEPVNYIKTPEDLKAYRDEVRDKSLDEVMEACETHPQEGSEDLGPGIALAIEIIRALKSPKPPIL